MHKFLFFLQDNKSNMIEDMKNGFNKIHPYPPPPPGFPNYRYSFLPHPIYSVYGLDFKISFAKLETEINLNLPRMIENSERSQFGKKGFCLFCILYPRIYLQNQIVDF